MQQPGSYLRCDPHYKNGISIPSCASSPWRMGIEASEQGREAHASTGGRPEAVVPEEDIVCLQHKQVRIILLLCVLEVAVVKLQPVRSPGLASLGAILGARAVLGVLCAVLPKARPVGECAPKRVGTCSNRQGATQGAQSGNQLSKVSSTHQSMLQHAKRALNAVQGCPKDISVFAVRVQSNARFSAIR